MKTFYGYTISVLLTGIFWAVAAFTAFFVPPERQASPVFWLITAGFAAFLLCFSIIRFEPDKLTVRWLIFLKKTIHFQDVLYLETTGHDKRHPECPTLIMLTFRDGSQYRLETGLFSVSAQKTIAEMLRSRIPSTPEKTFLTEHIRELYKRLNAALKITRGVYLFAFVIFLFLIGFSCYQQHQWALRLKKWKKSPAVILKNIQEKRHKIEFAFEYVWQGRKYQGSRIVFDFRCPSGIKTGDIGECIVNSASPENAALILYMQPNVKFIRLYAGRLFGGLVLLFLLFPLIKAFKAKIPSSAELEKYAAGLPPERISECSALALSVTQACPVTADEIRGKFAICEDRFCGFFPKHGWSLFAILDKQTRTILFKRRFNKGKLDKRNTENELPFSAVKCLYLEQRQKQDTVSLMAVTDAGIRVRLALAKTDRIADLLNAVPEIAHILGDIPVIC